MYWRELSRGGHYAILEQPTIFTEELRACFRLLRSGALSPTAMQP
jgi:epoxide hydrolase